MLIPKEESLNCVEVKDGYIIQPMLSWWDKSKSIKKNQINGKKIKKPFEYSSANNINFLTVKDIKNLIKNL